MDINKKEKALLEAAERIVAEYPSDEAQADPMNMFRVLEIQRREVYLCRVLTKLIDPLEHTHGTIFLKLFFDKVLSLPTTDTECKNACVCAEYVINGQRRIDIYIECGEYKIPIEAKIYAGDQESQLRDYAEYRSDNVPVYYLTLDGHLPSEYSTRSKAEDGGRLQENDYCCVSFAQHIVSWIDACLQECKDSPMTETVLQQLKDILIENTSQERNEIALKVGNELINTPESFKSAMAIENGLKSVKIELMNNFFNAVLARLEKYGAKSAGLEKISTYYNQKGSTWPGIVIPLKTYCNHKFALRLEVDHRLYYGICNYCEDKAPYYNDHSCMDQSKEAKDKTNFVSKYLMPDGAKGLNSSKSFYWWRYLPSNSTSSNKNVDLNFQDCNNPYIDLYDSNKFDKTVDRVCLIIEAFLNTRGEQNELQK